ncbi:RND transporter [Tardibacter chloracetimidivorans]|uniref:RND transporter n=1 Tax=Tardibacter chloracetimidivorans TaxID=1921510 RepID=A0A1L3ZYT0_9SPHN|nr:efflux transporter outer membrane subunit [Tardibacter chloracetimidivorans]API60787.1 RND transporter [Tardibacter chloracetimidivorans]
MASSRNRRAAVAAVALALLAGCTMQPRYERPTPPVAESWPTLAPDLEAGPAATDIGWQTFFNDERLRRLIALGLANNRDLRVAVLRIDEARGQYRIQRADLLPGVDVNAAAARSKTSPASVGPSIPPNAVSSGAGDQFQVNVGVSSFELDFWGRVRSLSDAARASYLATVEGERAFRISLIADIASAYLSLRALDERIALAVGTLESRNKGLELAKLRRDAGVTSALDYRQAETLLTQAETELASLRRQHAQTRNALGVLIGGPLPQDLPPPMPLLSQVDQRVGAAVPSDVLVSRPDVLSAEQRLRAANANIGAARAAFFPRISLTGSFGYASTDLDNLFGDDGETWSFGPSLVLPIFDFGRNAANLDVAEARKDIAVATYERTVQTAFQEVADALAARRYLTEQVDAQARALAAQRDLAELAELRYRNGVANYLEVLDAQRNLFAAEQALVESRRELLASLVSLYVALGGGLNP